MFDINIQLKVKACFHSKFNPMKNYKNQIEISAFQQKVNTFFQFAISYAHTHSQKYCIFKS